MFAVAQAISSPGDVVENVARHVRLSAIAIDDARLAPLDTVAAAHGLIVVAGAPLARPSMRPEC